MKHLLKQAGQMVTRNGQPLAGSTFGNVSISNSGEINAHDKAEALVMAQRLQSQSASGGIVKAQQTMTTAEKRAIAEERQAYVAEASSNDVAWASCGADLAEEIQEYTDRQSFLRRICQGQTLGQGEFPVVPMEQNIAEAVVASGATELGYQRITSKIFNPVEFEIKGNVRVDQLDLDRLSPDLLDKAFNDGLNAIMVKEDRLWKAAVDKSVGMVNPLNGIQGALTPRILSELRTAVTDWSLPASTAILSNSFWNDINGDESWATMLDPITRHDLVLNGQIATLQGMTLITDGYRPSNLKVLGRDEIYVVADPEYHGAYTTRGGVRSTPTNGANSGETTKGWLMSETFSFVLANMRSVAKGKRI
jgi:hypothetical protein